MSSQIDYKPGEVSERKVAMPVAFVSHGSPMVALERGPYADVLEKFGRSLNPAAILVISAHWEESLGVRILAAQRPKLIYDFAGFPAPLYQLKYDAPGSPALATAVEDALRESGLLANLDPQRGWDHGVWIPLRLMFPGARVPVVQISLPISSKPEQLFKVGGALAQFRKKNVLILGSGGVVHNLSLFRPDRKEGPVEGWASDFESWVKDAIRRQDFAALMNYSRQAPHAARAVPTPEHFAPLLVVLGAAQPYKKVESIFDGFQYGNISMHSFALR